MFSFLERAEIGYKCWMCNADTGVYRSESNLELCNRCDNEKVEQPTQIQRIEKLLYDNEYMNRESRYEFAATSIKIKIIGYNSLEEMLTWCNANIEDGDWWMPASPLKEMRNNQGRTSSIFEFAYDLAGMKEFLIKFKNNLRELQCFDEDGDVMDAGKLSNRVRNMIGTFKVSGVSISVRNCKVYLSNKNTTGDIAGFLKEHYGQHFE